MGGKGGDVRRARHRERYIKVFHGFEFGEVD